MTTRVTVRVPATSANMGPGFDCLAIALDIWNSVQVEVNSTGFLIRGEGANHLPKGESNLVYRCFRLCYREVGQEVPQVKITCDNGIPLGRGLGSSSAATIAGLVAANEICGRPLSQESILELAVRIEGHPDNASAALLGGCQIVVQDSDRLITASVPIPESLRAVVVVGERNCRR